MSTRVTLEVTYQPTSTTTRRVILDLTYRRWTPGTDPWAERPPVHLPTGSGTWVYTWEGGAVTFYGANNSPVMFITGLPVIAASVLEPWPNPFRVGMRGSIEISRVGEGRWTVTSVV